MTASRSVSESEQAGQVVFLLCESIKEHGVMNRAGLDGYACTEIMHEIRVCAADCHHTNSKSELQ